MTAPPLKISTPSTTRLLLKEMNLQEEPLTKLPTESLALEPPQLMQLLHLLHLQKTTRPTTTQALGKSLRHLPLVMEHQLTMALDLDLVKAQDWRCMVRPLWPLQMPTCPPQKRQDVTGG